MTADLITSFKSRNPVTNEVLFTFPITSKIEVDRIVDSAHAASLVWQKLGFNGRKKVLLAWAKILISRIDECAGLISRETGKPISDAKLETSLAIGHLTWAARNAKEILRTQHRRPGLLMFNMSAQVERSPIGVVGVIGPWNYPIFTPMGSISYALAAGNTVVFKPSEFTPGVGTWLAKTFAEVSPVATIFTVVTGFGETGSFLTKSAVNMIAFTGSTTTAKKVATACAENMTPAILECGGKDPVIIDSDADIKTAAEFTLWSAMSNAGQTCIGAERIYVHEKVATYFTSTIVDLAKSVHPGEPRSGSYGPATTPQQLEIIESHISAAFASGGKAAYGGLKSIKPPYVEPVILTDVPEESLAMQMETFGPVIIINKVKNMNEAIELANNSRYGLSASVWSKKQGNAIASQLQCGMVSINSVISFAAIASVPFGGVKDSGYGRIHGPEGLLGFTFARTVISSQFKLPFVFTSFRRSKRADNLIMWIVRFLHGKSIG